MIRDGVYKQFSVNDDGNVLNIDEVKSIIYFICTRQLLFYYLDIIVVFVFVVLFSVYSTVMHIMSLLLTLFMFNYVTFMLTK